MAEATLRAESALVTSALAPSLRLLEKRAFEQEDGMRGCLAGLRRSNLRSSSTT
jgi:hypothetical protein